MSREIYRRAHRTGLVSADIFRPGVDDLTELAALATNDIWDGSLIHVRDTNTIYSYDLESTDADDGLNVITPATSVGRWLKVGFGGAGTGSTADKWVDTTKITATESVVVDKTSEDDWPQEVVREEITVDGSLTVTDGYVIIGPQNLAETLEVYNQTQGHNIEFTAGDNLIMPQNAPPTTGAGEGSFFVGDGTGGTTPGQPYFREESNGAVSQLNLTGGGEDLAATLALGNSTGGTDMSFTAGDNLFLPENAPPTTPAGFGSFFVGDGTAGTTQGKAYFREPSSGAISQLGYQALDKEHINMPEAPGNTVEYYGWAARSCRVVSIKAFMTTLNTVGDLNLAVTTSGGATSLLLGSNFNLNGLSAPNTVDSLALSGTPSNLIFAADQVWQISVQSTDPGMDGAGIYIELMFEVI